MSVVEPCYVSPLQIPACQPRHQYQEVAELLATAIVRARTANTGKLVSEQSNFGLDFPGNQSVHTNPSQL